MSSAEQTKAKRLRQRYVFFPWIVLLLVWLATIAGVEEWFPPLLPFGLGQIAVNNLWSGMLLLLIGCSALWAIETQRTAGSRGIVLILGSVWQTMLLVLAQFSAFALLCLVSEVLSQFIARL